VRKNAFHLSKTPLLQKALRAFSTNTPVTREKLQGKGDIAIRKKNMIIRFAGWCIRKSQVFAK